MGLENGCNLAVLIEFANALCTLENLLRMVSIIAQEHMAAVIQLKVETAVNTSIGLHAILQLLGRTTIQLGHGHGGNAIVYINRYRLAELNASHILNGRDEVELYLTIVDGDVLGMEVALLTTVFVDADTLLHVGFHFQPTMDNQRATRLNETGIVAEALQISLFRAIDVEVVGVGRGDDAHPRAQPVERTVELVGLYHHIVALLAQNIVGAIVLRDTTQEGIALHMTLMHDVGAHGRSGGFAMCTGKTKAFVGTGQRAQHLCPFLNLKSFLAKPYQFFVLGWNGRRIDDERGLQLLTGMGNVVDTLFIVNEHALFLQLAGQV